MKIIYQLLLVGLLFFAATPVVGQALSVDITDGEALTGQVVCLDLIGENFTDVSGMQFVISYDPGALRFISVQGSIGGTNVLFGNPANTPGSIRATWSLFSSTGFTSAPGPFDFGDLCFEVLQPGVTSVDIVGTPIPIEFTASDETIITDFVVTGGTVTGTSRPDPTCDDGIRNGNETGVDCGGPDCEPCEPTCNDGIQNGNETGVDCGGPDCAACPTCDDGIRNGRERGVDCGGPDCAPCPATCDDGIQNGNETGVDCGGPDCAPCQTGGNDGCGDGSSELNICLGQSCDVAVGDQACVDITGTNFTNITSFQFDVTYAGGELDFESVTFNPALNNAIPSNEMSDGNVRIIYFDPGQNGASLPADGFIATMCFTNEGTSGTALNADGLIISNTNGETTGVLNDGRINGCAAMPTCDDGLQNGDETGVDCGGSCAPCQTMVMCGEDTDDVTFCVGQVCADAGAEVCVPIFVGNFTDLGGFQFIIGYDNANLTNPQVRPATELVQGTESATFADDGRISIVWNDLNLAGVTFPADQPAFEVCYTASNSSAAPIVFVDPDANVRAFDAIATPLPVSTNPGSVNDPGTCDSAQPTCDDGIQNGNETGIDCGGDCEPCVADPTCDDGIQNGNETGIDCGGDCEPCDMEPEVCGAGSDELNICLGETCNVPVGEQACVEITGTNFTDIVSFQFDVAYDGDELDFTSVTFNPDLNNVSPANELSDGLIRIIYFDPGLEGATLPEGGLIATLCFTNEGNQGTSLDASALVIASTAGATTGVLNNGRINGCGDTPPRCDDGIQNGDETGVDCGGSCAPCPDLDDLTFQIGSGRGAVGDTVCLPITGFNLDSLIAFQYSIRYDASLVEFIGRDPNIDYPLPGNLVVVNNDPGVIRALWNDPLADGDDFLPDGTELYGLCFRLLSDQVNLVTFSDGPTFYDFQVGERIVLATLLNGEINGTQVPTIISADLTNPSCSDTNDGSISLNVDGTEPLTYQWSGTNATSAFAGNLAAGTYSVTVTDVNGASDMASYTLVAPPPFSIDVATQPISCNEASDGAITLTTNGGVAPLIIDWNDGLPDNVLQQTGLDAGLYSVTVTDAGGCRRQEANIVIDEPTPVQVAGSVTGGNGQSFAINAVVQGGNGGYQFVWTGPDGFTANTEDLTGLTTAGEYCLTATDANGCSGGNCFTIGDNLIVNLVSVNPGCFGENDATVDVTVLGGTGAYTFSYVLDGTEVATTEDLMNAAPGTYVLTVTSGEETTGLTIPVEAATEILPRAVVNGASGANDGSITLNPRGGLPPYSFRWDDGATEQNRTNLAPGEYCVTITDSRQCPVESCYTITSGQLGINSIVIQDVDCPGDENGQVTFIVGGGQAPFTVAVTPLGTSFETADPNVSLTLPAGTFTVLVTDNRGTTTQTIVTVTEPDAFTTNVTAVSDVEGPTCTGTIGLGISGGTPDYTIRWNSGESTPTLANLCAGTYIATVTDASGCTFETEPIIIGRVEQELEAITNVACEDAQDGSIDVTTTGGQAPYTFSWTLARETDEISTDEDLTNVGPGDYELTVTDATGAVLSRVYTITQTSGFTTESRVVTDFNGFSVSCNGSKDGRIETTVTGNGTYTYEYFLGDELIGADSTLVNAAAGTYTVRVTGPGGCESTNTVTLTEPTAITVTAEVTGASCTDENDGSLSATPAGGTPPYTFDWSNGATGNRIVGLTPGGYNLTVTDANNCTMVETFTVGAPDDLVITFETTDATEGCNGAIRVLPLGGSGNYDFTYPELPNQANNSFAEGLCPGNYTIIVTDENGCQTVTMLATVLDRRAPCLSTREVITPNGDGLNETLVIFCSGEDIASDNSIQVFNRWGQLVYETDDYDCSDNGGMTCFEGRTNDGELLPEGAYYYVFDYANPNGQREQQRGSFTIIRD